LDFGDLTNQVNKILIITNDGKSNYVDPNKFRPGREISFK
jgi:hypothetical protein